MQPRNKIAVIGGGVAGIVSAYILSREHDVTLIEANDYVGGHTNTITIPNGPDEGTPVDTGFIVLNDKNYPNFRKFLGQLGVETRKSEMSFSFFCRDSGLAYSSHFPNGLFAQRRNLFNPEFLQMLRDIVRFNKEATADLRGGRLNGHTLGEYLAENNYSTPYIEQHLAPCAAAIWSTPASEVLEFPVESFLRFYDNHGLLQLSRRPQWFTVAGGSQSYVRAFLKEFPGTVLINSPVQAVSRAANSVQVMLKGRSPLIFDKVVIAAHADQALRMLADPSPEERRLLGPWRYHKNHTVLHTHSDTMSPNRRVWSSWNYIRAGGEQQAAVKTIDRPVSVAYYMNRLQGLQTQREYFVSLNDPDPIPDEQIITEIMYTHPHYSFESLATQRELPLLNGPRNTYFCGSYFGFGFHEDAVRSAVQVGQAFGLEL
ncbi:MAG: FAD-dependent oxidoreductase [Anaerolineae bacterium]